MCIYLAPHSFMQIDSNLYSEARTHVHNTNGWYVCLISTYVNLYSDNLANTSRSQLTSRLATTTQLPISPFSKSQYSNKSVPLILPSVSTPIVVSPSSAVLVKGMYTYIPEHISFLLLRLLFPLYCLG